MAEKLRNEWRKVQRKYETLVEELDLENTRIVDYLFQTGTLTNDDRDRVQKTQISSERNRAFLNILLKKDDTAYGHFLKALKDNQDHLVKLLEPPRKVRSTTGRGSQVSKVLADFSVQELKDWLQPILDKNDIPVELLDKIEEEKITGKVFQSMSDEDFKEVLGLKAFGQRRILMLAVAEVTDTSATFRQIQSRPSKPSYQRNEFPREFKHTPSVTEKYSEGKILNIHETHSGKLTDPVRRFYSCTDEEDICSFIADRVAEFSAACLNDRSNGTIYFGICEDDDPDHEQNYGQVLGIVVDKKECEDAIRQRIRKGICGEAENEAALKCIQPAVFVNVLPADCSETENIYVCEVDVEPACDLVKDHAFFLKHTQDGQESESVLFRFRDGVPFKQTPREVERFSSEKTKLTEERKQQERATSPPKQKDLVQILKNCLCGGGDKLDGNFYPLLAMSAVNTDHPEFEDKFSFLWQLDWRCIFDFDPTGDEKGLYKFLYTNKEMVYKVKRPSDFVVTPTVAQSSLQGSPDENFQDMTESELKTWVFCNGFTEGEEKGLNITEWKRERSKGFREAVKFFKEAIPDGRAIILIVLTSNDDILIEASEELLLNFEHQWLLIAESKQLADAWMDGLLSRHVDFDKERCLVNVSFSDVNKVIRKLQGTEVLSQDACIVRLSNGMEKEIPKRLVQEMCDLDIMSANQCSSIEECTEEERSALSMEKGDDFYKGNPATFWNFYFQGHVCERDKYALLLRYTRETLQGDTPDNASVGAVAVYHQPGAGGTTIGMNVLWDLRNEYKCCILKRITNETARQVVKLYEFADTDTPVLLMVDNEDEEKIDQLQRNIEDECQNKGIFSLACVFLLCSRKVTLPQEHLLQNIVLKQDLSPREKQFFIDKYDELKKKGTANLDNLLGLNIMKENFNESFIKKTVASFIKEYKSDRERVLLKYTALLNCFDLSFRAIPASCFDPVMPHFHGRGSRPWEETLTKQPLLKFTRNTKLSGKNKCLKISNKLLCRYILDITLEEEKGSIGELMEEFLNSAVFQRNCTDFAYRELVYIVRDIMKKREWIAQNRRSPFSPFIQMMLDDKEADQAIVCMENVFTWTSDPIVAQQLARIHIHLKKLDKAEHWAAEATRRWPTNSYLWDTHGQICRFRLYEIREDCENRTEPPDIRIILETINYARKGFETFRKVQALSSHERSIPPNTAGLFGQMDIAFLLLKIFKDIMPIDDLQNFFSEAAYVPEAMKHRELAIHIDWLKSVLQTANSCLRHAEDTAEIYSGEGYGQTSAKIFLSGENLKRYQQQFASAFGKEDLATADPETLSPDKRRRLMRNLGGYSLNSVVSLCREPGGRDTVRRILQLAILNLRQQRSSHSNADYSMALASALTLFSRHDPPEQEVVHFSELLKWSLEFFKQKMTQGSQYLDLDPYLFLLIFHWPCQAGNSSGAEQCQPAELNKAIDLAKENFSRKFAGDPGSRRRNTPLYFVTNQPGNWKVVSKDQLQLWSSKEGRQTRFQIGRLLQSQRALTLLQRFSGILIKNGNEVELRSKDHTNKLKIRLFVRENSPTLWNKRVFFVLAFGLGGPLACDVRADVPSPAQAFPMERSRRSDIVQVPFTPLTVDLDERISQIRRQLIDIDHLRHKSVRTREEAELIRSHPRLLKEIHQLQHLRHQAMIPHF